MILAIDPSGNFNEGKGTTGWSLISDNKSVVACGQILAKNYNNKFDYWLAVLDLLKLDVSHVVIEDFLLYENKAKVQINSRFETSKLIGIIELHCHLNNISYTLQKAVEVKKRWTDDILVYNNIIQRSGNKYYAGGVLISDHIRDSIRHGIHYITYKKDKKNEHRCI